MCTLFGLVEEMWNKSWRHWWQEGLCCAYKYVVDRRHKWDWKGVHGLPSFTNVARGRPKGGLNTRKFQGRIVRARITKDICLYVLLRFSRECHSLTSEWSHLASDLQCWFLRRFWFCRSYSRTNAPLLFQVHYNDTLLFALCDGT